MAVSGASALSILTHGLHINAIRHIQEWVKENEKKGEKVTVEEATLQLMRVFIFKRATAQQYIRDMLDIGMFRINDGHLILNKETKK